MAEQKFLIVMRSGPIPGSSYYIEKDEVFIGRDLTNDLPVPDPEISRRHARFLRHVRHALRFGNMAQCGQQGKLTARQSCQLKRAGAREASHRLAQSCIF